MARTTTGGDFTYVTATTDEIETYVRKHGRRPSQYRVACNECGTRIWGSGIGIGSHRRGCPGAPCEHCGHGKYHHDFRTGACVECTSCAHFTKQQ